MALLPTLGEQILVELDVEGVTHELQTKSRAHRLSIEPAPPPSESSMASSIELVRDQDIRSDVESASASSISGQEDGSSHLGESAQSWDQLSIHSSQPPFSPSVSPGGRSAELLTVPQLSDSITTASSELSSRNEPVSAQSAT